MNLLDILDISYESVRFYGLTFNEETLAELEKYKKLKRNDIDKIVNYLFYKSYLYSQSDSKFYNDTGNNKKYDQTMSLLEEICDCEPNTYYSLINKHYEYLIETFKFCKSQIIIMCKSNGIVKEVKYYLVNNHYLDLARKDNFISFYEFFKKNLDIFSEWLSNFENKAILNNYNYLIETLVHINNNKFKPYLEVFYSNVTTYLEKESSKELLNNEKDKIRYLHKDFFDRWLIFLKESRSNEVYKFESLKDNIYIKFELVINEYGHFTDFLNDEIIELLEMKRKDIKKNGVFLTEITHLNGKPLFSNLSNPPLLAFSAILPDNDKYFNESRTIVYNCNKSYLTNIIDYIINDEKVELIKSLTSYVEYFDKKFTINDSYTIKEDFIVLYEMIFNMPNRFDLLDTTPEKLLSIFYGPTMYVSSIIEKILRNFYLFKRKDIDYTINKNINLNFLLSEQCQEVMDLLGFEQFMVFRYQLLYDKTEGGLNIRNNLAHLDYKINKDEIYYNFMIVSSTLFSLISTLLLHFDNKIQ